MEEHEGNYSGTTGCKAEITEQSWTEIVKIIEKKLSAIDRGELIRTFIIPAETGLQMMIMVHHLVGDGKSLIYFIQDIMNALAGATLNYKPLVLLSGDSFAETSLPLPAELYARYCRYKWKSRYFTWQDYYDLHNKY